MTTESRQTKHRKLLVQHNLTINPITEPDILSAFDAVVAKQGGNKNAAIKAAILHYARSLS